MKVIIDGKQQGDSGGGGSDYAKGIAVGNKIITFDIDNADLPVFTDTYWQQIELNGEVVKILTSDN